MAVGHLKQDPDLWNRGTRRAYVIGASAYGPPIPSLVTPRGDARDVGDLLASAHGYRVTRLHEGNVGLGAVLALLGQMKAEVRAEDRVLFYFAGHGVPPDSDASKAGYLLPETAVRNEPGTFLSMDMLYEHLAALPCRHLLVILDCCFAGSFRWARTRPQRFFDAIPERRIYVARVRQFLRRVERGYRSGTCALRCSPLGPAPPQSMPLR